MLALSSPHLRQDGNQSLCGALEDHRCWGLALLFFPIIRKQPQLCTFSISQSHACHYCPSHLEYAELLGSLYESKNHQRGKPIEMPGCWSHSLLEERSQCCAFSKPPRGVHATGLCPSPQQLWASRLFQFFQHSLWGEEECHHSQILQKGQGHRIWMYTLCPATVNGHGQSLLNCASFRERPMWWKWNCSLHHFSPGWSPFCACLRYWKSLTGLQSSHKGVLLLKSCQVWVSEKVWGLVLLTSASYCCHSLCWSLYNENVFMYACVLNF